MQENTSWQNWIRPDGIDDLEALGFVGDTSPSDNACPNWSHKLYPIRIWVDLPLEFSDGYVYHYDPEEWYQYVVEHNDSQEQLLCTNDIADVIDLIKNIWAASYQGDDPEIGETWADIGL